MKLKGDNLRGFFSNWDQVMAGIPKVPEVSVLETLVFNQVKNSKPIAHDLREYHRAEEGTEKKSDEFLVTAVRPLLGQEAAPVQQGTNCKNPRCLLIKRCTRSWREDGVHSKGELCQMEQRIMY